MKKDKLSVGCIYHVVTRSIAEYKIFNTKDDFSRMMQVLRYYQNKNSRSSFSNFLKSKNSCLLEEVPCQLQDLCVEIMAFCIMPTHLHLILKQLQDDGVSEYMSKILNSYSRYFNLKHKRKGPLWEGRFKSILVTSDEQLIHLTRYVHLNPVTAYLVDQPEDWLASSYKEFVYKKQGEQAKLSHIGISMSSEQYKEFVEGYIIHQRAYAKIKRLVC